MSDVQENSGPVKAAVFADFICPWSYIVQDSVDRLVNEYDIEVMWKPHWLHPETPPEGTPRPVDDGTGKKKATMEWMKELNPERAAKMRSPGKLQYSFRAFEGLTYAEDHGMALPFKSAVFDALWVEGEDIAEVATLQRAADKVGLDGDEMGRVLSDGTLTERTRETVETVRRIGIGQTPTIILGKTMIPGYHYYEVFQTVLQKQGILSKAATV